MKNAKFILLISSLILFASCRNGELSENSPTCVFDIDKAWEDYQEALSIQSKEDEEISPPRLCNIPEREPGANLKDDVNLRSFNPEQEARMRDALKRIEVVVNSVEFKERVINHIFNGKYQFNDNNGMSNEEIYDLIMSGKETLLPYEDETMNLDITLYYRNNSTVGYTYPDTLRIWVNNKFFSRNNIGQIANNAFHEWTHKVGFGHARRNNPTRPYSVPYALGGIIQEMVNNL